MGIFRKKNRQDKENFGSILRIVEGVNTKHPDGKYKRHCQVKDNNTGEVLIECDTFERAIYSELQMTDNKNQTWKVKPNRKFITTRWYIHSPEGNKVSEIRLPGFIRMMTPFTRTYLFIIDHQTDRKLSFIDLESGFFDFIFGSSPLVWSITERKNIIAKVRYLSKEDKEDENREKPKKKGFFSKLKKWLKGSDWALHTYSSEPAVNAPTFIALYLIYQSVSSGAPE